MLVVLFEESERRLHEPEGDLVWWGRMDARSRWVKAGLGCACGFRAVAPGAALPASPQPGVKPGAAVPLLLASAQKMLRGSCWT